MTSTMQRIFAMALVAVMVACAWWPAFNTRANEEIDAGLKRALATYATARLLNGVISVVQKTQIAAAPAGVGVTLSPGEILDPLNDLVEQFSLVMLVAIVAFGIEKVLMSIGASWVISLALSLVAATWALLLVFSKAEPNRLAHLLLILLLARFAMPVSLMGTDMIFRQFMAEDYRESQEIMSTIQKEAGEPEIADVGFWEKLSSKVSAAQEKLKNLKQSAENAIDRIIRLMVVFVLETIVLPILFIGALWGAGRGFLQIRKPE